jgi:hypothetical protein
MILLTSEPNFLNEARLRLGIVFHSASFLMPHLRGLGEHTMKKLIGLLLTLTTLASSSAFAQVNLGAQVSSEIHVAHLVREGGTLPYKLATDHIAGITGSSLRDIAQGNYTTTAPAYTGDPTGGAFRFLTQGQQAWERGCAIGLIASGYPTTIDAFVEHGNFNQPGGFAGFPNLNDETLGYQLLSTPNFSFQGNNLPTTILPQGGSTKYYTELVFEHAIPDDVEAIYESYGLLLSLIHI